MTQLIHSTVVKKGGAISTTQEESYSRNLASCEAWEKPVDVKQIAFDLDSVLLQPSLYWESAHSIEVQLPPPR